MYSDAPFPSEEMARNAARAWSLARSIRIAMVSSLDGALRNPISQPEGADPQPLAMYESAFGTRPMRARFKDNSNVIWFILARSSLVGFDQNEQPMLVTFSTGGEGDHVAFHGDAVLSDDREVLHSIWDAYAEIRFPQGGNDEAVVLLKFVPRSAFFWTGGQDLVSFVIHYVSAKLTGEPQSVGRRGGVITV